VSQLLTLARQEPDAQRPFVQLDLAALVRQVIGEFAPLADLKKIDLGVDASQSEFMNGDKESLKILVGNLVDNAIRYTPEGGKIDVTLGNGSSGLVLRVKDSGPGIPIGDRERIFERFFRVAGNEVQGSGLGLAIVKQIAQRHGATVEVSNGENEAGAMFSVKFRPSVAG
jgi:two-component system OmpR family sensor kinase